MVLPISAPPPMTSMSCCSDVPMGTSTRPVFFTLPDSEKHLVPGLLTVPTERYQSTPRSMMSGTLAKVSTLFTQVGWP